MCENIIVEELRAAAETPGAFLLRHHALNYEPTEESPMNDKPDTMDELEVPAEIRVDAPAESRLDVPAEVRALAREHTTDAIDRLAGLLESEDHRVSLAAANALLDRGWGKVEPTADGTVMPTPPITVIRAPEIVADSEAWLEQYAPPRKPQ